MKNSIVISLFVVISFFCSCTTQRGMYNNDSQTLVQLKENNFRIIKTISGEATANYFLFMGLDAQNLAGRAKIDLMSKADLVGKARALVNFATDIKYTTFMGIYYSKTYYVSADVIEFGNENTWANNKPSDTVLPKPVQSKDYRLKIGDKVSFYTKGNEKMEGSVKEVDGYTISILYLDSKKRITTIVLPLKEVTLLE